MEVKRLPPEEEPGAPTRVRRRRDRSTARFPARYWINLRTTDLHSKYSLADLTFHESIPGHICRANTRTSMPLIRQLLAFNAYSEGWALYAQQLADELGAYENDPVGRLGYLQAIAFRACRLVVDTGIHAKRWTREQGVKFFVDVNGSNPLEVASEVDRYCSWPGQACGYKVGHSEINRQREQGEDGARREVRPEGVQRHRGARRQRAARRAREERRRIRPGGQGVSDADMIVSLDAACVSDPGTRVYARSRLLAAPTGRPLPRPASRACRARASWRSATASPPVKSPIRRRAARRADRTS